MLGGPWETHQPRPASAQVPKGPMHKTVSTRLLNLWYSLYHPAGLHCGPAGSSRTSAAGRLPLPAHRPGPALLAADRTRAGELRAQLAHLLSMPWAALVLQRLSRDCSHYFSRGPAAAPSVRFAELLTGASSHSGQRRTLPPVPAGGQQRWQR